MTKQRKAILDCLTKASGPLSVDEIYSYTATITPHINPSTIYRNIKALLEEKIISALEVPGSTARYEMTSQAHRHHFLCDSCRKVYNIPICPKEIHSMIPPGFQMTRHSIILNGYCQTCVR